MKLPKTRLSKFLFTCQNSNLSQKIKILRRFGNSVVGRKIRKDANVSAEIS